MAYIGLMVSECKRPLNDSFLCNLHQFDHNLGFRDKHNYRRLKYVVNGIKELQEYLQYFKNIK